MAWPPTLPELKDDLGIPVDDDGDDAALTRRLNAVIAFVQRTRKDAFLLDDCGNLVEPIELVVTREEASLTLGALMLAGRLFARRRSADAILFMSDTGTTRVPFGDDDIARLLRLGKHAKPRVG